MASTFQVVVTGLLVVFLSHKLLSDYQRDLERSRQVGLTQHSPVQIKASNSQQKYMPHIKPETSPIVPELSQHTQTMKNALQKYLDSQLQQNSPPEVALKDQFELPTQSLHVQIQKESDRVKKSAGPFSPYSDSPPEYYKAIMPVDFGDSNIVPYHRSSAFAMI